MNTATTARTNTQSAAIALLAATTAKPQAQPSRETDDSFAKALSSANQSQSKSEAGLFANPQAASDQKVAKPAEKDKPKQPDRREEEPAGATTETKPGSATKDTKEAADTKDRDPTASTESKAEHKLEMQPDRPLENKLGTKAPSVDAQPDVTTFDAAQQLETASAATNTQPIATLTAPVTARPNPRTLDAASKSSGVESASTLSSTEQSLQPVSNGTSDQQVAPEAAAPKRNATDPLRLIPPAEAKPIVAEAAVEPKPASTNAAAVSANDDAAIAPKAAPSNASDSKQNNSNQPQGFGFTQPGKVVPQSAAQATSTSSPVGQVGSTATSNTNATVPGTPRIDPPIQTPRGRAPEVPVNVKLTARPSNDNSGVSQTDADAAATQISRGLTAALRNKGGQLTLWMNPESLGKLRVQLSIEGGTIAARFEATSEATKQLLTQNVDSLRSALEARGLKASNIEVVSIPDWSVKANTDQFGTQGSKAQNQGGSPEQQSNQTGGQNSGQGSSQSNQQPRQDLPAAGKFDWLRDPEPIATTRTDPSAQVRTDSRLITLNARLELDAVA
ncbi:MAG: flagellar hook-length control protein FliK [Phycisphaerales bacterium]|nr:flagellar hook-length control protein FliK [Phycisphaerales bacterium]